MVSGDEEEHSQAIMSVFRNRFPRGCLLPQPLPQQPRQQSWFSLKPGKLWSFMWPIFEYGVLEFVFYALDDLIFQIFKEFKKITLQEELSTYDVQERLLYQATDGMQQAKDELEMALEVVCQSHYLNLAQTWTPMIKEKGVAFTLATYCIECFGELNDYRILCKIFPLEEGRGIVWRTLVTKKPCFCENTSIISSIRNPFSIMDLDKKTCFAVCLNSYHTGNLDYILEFYWIDPRDKIILLEAILMTLKMYLPSFKVVSGEELGEQLCVTSMLVLM